MNSEPSMIYEPKRPFYKRIPVIGIIIFILLIGAWVFRWDYKITQTIDNVKLMHKVDRWTGDHWYELYGVSNNIIYSGAERACLTNGVKAEGEQANVIEQRRTGATIIWVVTLAGTLGFISFRVLKNRD